MSFSLVAPCVGVPYLVTNTFSDGTKLVSDKKCLMLRRVPYISSPLKRESTVMANGIQLSTCENLDLSTGLVKFESEGQLYFAAMLPQQMLHCCGHLFPSYDLSPVGLS